MRWGGTATEGGGAPCTALQRHGRGTGARAYQKHTVQGVLGLCNVFERARQIVEAATDLRITHARDGVLPGGLLGCCWGVAGTLLGLLYG